MMIEISKTPNNVLRLPPPLDVHTDQHAKLLAVQLWHFFADGRRRVVLIPGSSRQKWPVPKRLRRFLPSCQRLTESLYLEKLWETCEFGLGFGGLFC